MLSASQVIIEILVGLLFLVAAIACLLWPEKLYKHALSLVRIWREGVMSGLCASSE
jgi:hypothetical protein